MSTTCQLVNCTISFLTSKRNSKSGHPVGHLFTLFIFCLISWVKKKAGVEVAVPNMTNNWTYESVLHNVFLGLGQYLRQG